MIHISTSFALLVVAIIILVCIAGSRLSGRLGVPTLFIFIMLGMLFGSDGIFKIPFGNFALAEQVCSVALIFIMFYGGFGTRWSEAKPVAGRSILLSSVGVVLTALLTGLFCHLVLNMALMEGMLLGAVLGSTDAASVFSILRSRKLNLKYGTASMLELESGSNDPFAYMMTVILLSAMTGSVSGGSAVLLLIRQLAFGLLTGATVAWLVTWLLKRYAFYGEGFDTIFVFAAAIISYALASQIGGNGYLSVYLTGIILGNQELKNQKALVGFFDAFIREESKPFLRLWRIRIVADRQTVATVILVRCEMSVKEQCTVLHMNPVVVEREVRRIAFHPHGVYQSGNALCNPLREIRLDAVVDFFAQLVLIRDSALGCEERAVYAFHRMVT